MHQPNYLPWIGLFSKISLADCLVLLDNAQFVPIVGRNKIRTETGSAYLTIPVGRGFNKARILEVPLPSNSTWQLDHWKSIYHHYQKAPFFKDYRDFFEGLYQREFRYLWEITQEVIIYLLGCFHIDIELRRASEISVNRDLEKTDMAVALLEGVGADVYLSGPSGKDYLDVDKFSQSSIELKFFRFQHPEYKQRYPGFVTNLSAIDLLFNLGSEASSIIRSSGCVE